MNINKANIGNALTSVAPDHVVAVSADIYDEALEKYQSDINDKVVSEVLSISYEELVNLKNNNLLKPGQNYRITNYETVVRYFEDGSVVSAGHPFDLIVLALSNSELSNDASACLHEGEGGDYFLNNKLESWVIKYELTNDNTKFDWVNVDNGKGVIYYMKDEFNNEAWYDFKNIKFLRNVNWFESNPKFTSASPIDTDTYFYTFSVVDGYEVRDDSLYSGDNYHATDNHLGRDASKTTKLNNTIFINNINIPNNNGTFNNIIADGHRNNTFGSSIYNNKIGHNFKDNIINGKFVDNIIDSSFERNHIYDNFIYNSVDSSCSDNRFNGRVDSCVFKSNYTLNNFIGDLLYSCKFGSNIKYISDMPSMSNITLVDKCINSDNQVFLKNLIVSATGINLLDSITSLNNEISHTIYNLPDNKYGIYSYESSEYIYNMGEFSESSVAEDKATSRVISFDKNKVILKYSVSGRVGVIYQQINNDSCYQTLYWDGKRYNRAVTNTAIGTTKTNWVEAKDLTIEDRERLDWLIDNEVPTKSYIDEKSDLKAFTNVNQNTNTSPRDYVGKLKITGLKKSTTVGLTNDEAGEYIGLLGFNAWKGDTGGTNKVATHEIGFCGNGDIKVRSNGETGTNWNNCNWRTLIDSTNIVTDSKNGLMTSTDKVSLDRVSRLSVDIGNLTTWNELLTLSAELAKDDTVYTIHFIFNDWEKSGVIEQQVQKNKTTQTLKWDGFESIRVLKFNSEGNCTNPTENFGKLRTMPTHLNYNSSTRMMSFVQKDCDGNLIPGHPNTEIDGYYFGTVILPLSNSSTAGLVYVNDDYTKTASNTALSLKGARALYDKLIESVNYENITYESLKSLLNSNSLIPGKKYRITDYKTTVNKALSDVKIANSDDRQFDIIVEALTSRKLNENASACFHDGDTYFLNKDVNIETWEIKYSFDNDVSRFDWADTENGKGVIYYMKDDRGNECPYDFKNILFKNTNYSSNTTEDNYYYTFSYIINSVLLDGSVESDIKKYCYDNKIEKYLKDSVQVLNKNIFKNNKKTGKCIGNKLDLNCTSNIFEEDAHSNIFSIECTGNNLGPRATVNYFGANCDNNKLGSDSQYNKLDAQCQNNNLGNKFAQNTMGLGSSNNLIGDNCTNNIFGQFFSNNNIGTDLVGSTFAKSVKGIKIGNKCHTLHFGVQAQYNEVGDESRVVVFGDFAEYNKVGNDCRAIYIKDFSDYNKIPNYHRSIVLECNSYISFPDNAKKEKLRQYVKILPGVNGISEEEPLVLDIQKGKLYETKVALNSKEELVIYCDADLISEVKTNTSGVEYNTSEELLTLNSATYNEETLEVIGLTVDNETLNLN